MRTDWSHLEEYRVTRGQASTNPGETFGRFLIRKGTENICVIATSGDPEEGNGGAWEHVSIHVHLYADARVMRVPTWAEMCRVKSLFWLPTECVMQLHPPDAEHINCHPAVLHLWRPIGQEIPRPPLLCV